MVDPTMRTAVLRNLADLPEGSNVCVGVSGGADSLALLRVVVQVGRERSFRVSALIIDHNLQANSLSVATNAVKISAALGADPVVLYPVSVAQGPGSGGLEAAAREARRNAFEIFAKENSIAALLLAHTLDDQAETVLLGLARGSGARSLSGMREIDGLYRRPLLRVSREVVRASVSDIEFYEDPHNEDARFARVRVRHELLPKMEELIGPGIAQALARTADLLRDDADALDEIARQVEFTGLVEQVANLSSAVRTRILRTYLINGGVRTNDLTREHVQSVDALVMNWRGQGPVDLPGGMNVVRESGRLVLTKSTRLNEEK